MNQNLKQLVQQIGKPTLFMLGSYNLLYSDKDSYISFRIRGSKKCNYIRIKYNAGSDLYSMHFSKLAKYEEKNVIDLEGIYCDQLHTLIEKHTGLLTQHAIFISRSQPVKPPAQATS